MPLSTLVTGQNHVKYTCAMSGAGLHGQGELAMCRRMSGAGDALYDLRPFMFGTPLLMQEGASLTRALTLFRQMGLHHILVAPQDPRAIGFITRKVSELSCLAYFCAPSIVSGPVKRYCCASVTT